MGLPAGYVRKGKPIAYQFDFDALEMLYELVPTNEDVSEVLVCYSLGVYETQSNPQATRVIA